MTVHNLHKHVLSTHLVRFTARRAARHYKRLQRAARLIDDPSYEDATRALLTLGLSCTAVVEVERAVHERAKWRVVAIMTGAERLPGLNERQSP